MRYIASALAIVGLVGSIAFYTNLPSHQSLYSEQDLSEYVRYVAKFGKSYATKEEFLERLSRYKTALSQIMDVNSQNGNDFHLAVNKFADWTPQEYRRLLGLKNSKPSLKAGVKVLPVDKLPDKVDWREQGAVNPVQNQAACGSCWTFCAAAAIEGAHKIKTGDLLKLSEQQFVDCCQVGPSDGCNGGEMWGAFECAKTQAQMLEADYPYTSGKGEYGKCLYDESKGKVKVTNWWNVMDNDSKQLKAAIAIAPVTVAIQADTIIFQYYSGGVINTPRCGTKTDHGVLAVGYGKTETGVEYYIVRNSWGPDWGDQGYIKIGIEEGAGICGIQTGSVWAETE